jgi:hypothetical protein
MTAGAERERRHLAGRVVRPGIRVIGFGDQ